MFLKAGYCDDVRSTGIRARVSIPGQGCGFVWVKLLRFASGDLAWLHVARDGTGWCGWGSQVRWQHKLYIPGGWRLPQSMVR